MSSFYSHGREFADQARVILESKDHHAFVHFLEKYWPAKQLRELLTCGYDDAVNIALVGLSLIGEMSDSIAIAPLLHDDDGETASFAEHALWSIWFRAGGPKAHDELVNAVRLIGENQLDLASACLTSTLGSASDFAEGYHQLAMIEFLRGDYVQAITHCRAALVLNPWHFGAMAGLGHCHAAMSQFEMARCAYQRALELNPRLEGVRQALRQLRDAAPLNNASIA